MDERLAEIGAARGGPFRRAEALAAGYSAWRIRELVASGEWTRLRPGILVESDRIAREPGRRHAVHVAATVLALGEQDTAGSHESAAVVHGIALLERHDEQTVTVTRPGARDSRDRCQGGRIHRASLPTGQVMRLYGAPITTPARTVADLARRLPFPAAVVTADSAMHALGVRHQDVADVLAGCRRWPGAAQAERAIAAANPRARSPLETLARLMCKDAGLPEPEVSVLIGDETGPFTEADLYWRQYRLILLADGMFKYNDPRSNRNEKLTQERLENLGFKVVRLTWNDVTKHPKESITRIRAALTR